MDEKSIQTGIIILAEIGFFKKWIPKLKKGALHKDLGINPKQKIPLQLLLDKKRQLHEESKTGDLSDDKSQLLKRVNLALTFRKMKKK